MTTPFFVPNIHSQVVDQGGAPDPLALLLQGFQQGLPLGEAGYKESQQNSRSSAENDIRKQELSLQQAHFKLLQEQEKTKQAHLAHQQEITNQVGTGYNTFLEHMIPHAAATGQLGQALGQPQQGQPQSPQDQFGIPQGLPFQLQGSLPGGQAQAPGLTQQPLAAPPRPEPDTGKVADPFDALGAALQGMSPEAIPILMTHIAPIIGLFQKGEKSGLQQADSGKYKTLFDPNKGYFNPDTKKWQPDLPKGYTTEELEKQANDRQDRLDRAAATDAYRTEVRGQVASRQFDSITKPLRDRSALLQQAVMTVHQAQFATDPEQRRILTSTALLNFVQASDQKVNLRYQMVQFVKQNLDPSFSGKWENAINLLATGQYPNKVYTALETHLGSLLNQSKTEFEKMRAGEVKRHPELENYLRQSEDIFGNNPTGTQPPSGVLPPPP